MAEEAQTVPVIALRDTNGQLIAIPEQDLEQYKVPPEKESEFDLTPVEPGTQEDEVAGYNWRIDWNALLRGNWNGVIASGGGNVIASGGGNFRWR